jgi:catechol 2,3-dioxygenase-like lactoylglutathione lyase family enzyme
MMNADTPVMCFIATARPQEAAVFYGGVLGLRLLEDSPFALVFETSGRMLRVQKMPQVVPAPNTVLGWDVTDIESEMRELAAKGVGFTRFEGLAQDEAGVWLSPGGHKVAWFRDPDGNNLSLTEFAA